MSSAMMSEAVRDGFDPVSAGSRYYAEDGWVFREYPGKGIECVGRYEDLKGTVRLESTGNAVGGHQSLRTP
jgi:hypothetical protein